jgi:ABC-type antimicrobial peptide transport system permease subunit
MVVLQGFRLVCLGILVGLLGTVALGRFLSGVLFGIQPGDPLTLAAVVAFVTLVSLGACFFPARWASAVDPAVSLREE